MAMHKKENKDFSYEQNVGLALDSIIVILADITIFLWYIVYKLKLKFCSSLQSDFVVIHEIIIDVKSREESHGTWN